MSQRLSAADHVRPQVTHVGDAARHRPQRERSRADFASFHLVPRAWRRNRGAGLRTYGIGCRERGAIPMPSGIYQDAPASIGLAELLREVLRISAHESCTDGVCEL